MTMTWQEVWRKGFVPQMDAEGLEALRVALIRDDERLAQKYTTYPHATGVTADWPLESCCAVTFCGWRSDRSNVITVGDATEFFAKACYEADKALGESGAVRHFLCWFDSTPRDEMREALIAEINHNLEEIAVTV